MITRVQVKNFRNLADIDVHLGPLTVLVGRNGAGKSTFLDVLRFVRDALRLGLDTAISQRGGISAVRRRSPNGRPYDIEVSLELKDPISWANYALTLGAGNGGKLYVKREVCRIITNQDNITTEFETKKGKWIPAPSDWLIRSEMMSGITINTDLLILPTLARFISDLDALQKYMINTTFYSIST